MEGQPVYASVLLTLRNQHKQTNTFTWRPQEATNNPSDLFVVDIVVLKLAPLFILQRELIGHLNQSHEETLVYAWVKNTRQVFSVNILD